MNTKETIISDMEHETFDFREQHDTMASVGEWKRSLVIVRETNFQE